jgi:hypothetical protein
MSEKLTTRTRMKNYVSPESPPKVHSPKVYFSRVKTKTGIKYESFAETKQTVE